MPSFEMNWDWRRVPIWVNCGQKQWTVKGGTGDTELSQKTNDWSNPDSRRSHCHRFSLMIVPWTRHQFVTFFLIIALHLAEVDICSFCISFLLYIELVSVRCSDTFPTNVGQAKGYLDNFKSWDSVGKDQGSIWSRIEDVCWRQFYSF